MQASLLDRFQPAPQVAAPTVTLRPYQVTACDRIDEQHRAARSTLLVMATGTGKTTVFAEVIRRRPGRALVLAHRDELIRQAARRIHVQTGRRVSVEKAAEMADATSDVVVASVQTLYQDGRLGRFRPDDFELLIVDEAHHAVADSYTKILAHFSGAKVLGVTATPDRADEAAMGAVFEDVAFIYEIGDAIADGWLCPVRATQVFCAGIDLSDVKTVAGDLNAGELDAVMKTESALHQVAKPTIELAGGRRTLVFTTSVENAHRLAEVFNRYKPDSAQAVDGGTDAASRRRILADHQAGRYQFLCNVGVLTEGYDDPMVSCVAMGRPTKSRALYAQMAGRGTRIAPGKEDLLILDFVGNSGRHALVSASDVLAGKHPDEVLDRAKQKIADEPGQDVRKALDEAAREIAEEKERARAESERRRNVRARVQYGKRDVDPFKVFGVRDPAEFGSRFGDGPPSDKQLNALGRFKIPIPEGLTKRGAMRLMGEAIRRSQAGECSFGQVKVLERHGYDVHMSRNAASRVIDALAANRWQRLDPKVYASAIGQSEAGENG